ncbi:MAG: hypothetical protein RL077_938 [Verrucomicrobiota bacterium]
MPSCERKVVPFLPNVKDEPWLARPRGRRARWRGCCRCRIFWRRARCPRNCGRSSLGFPQKNGHSIRRLCFCLVWLFFEYLQSRAAVYPMFRAVKSLQTAQPRDQLTDGFRGHRRRVFGLACAVLRRARCVEGQVPIRAARRVLPARPQRRGGLCARLHARAERSGGHVVRRRAGAGHALFRDGMCEGRPETSATLPPASAACR